MHVHTHLELPPRSGDQQDSVSSEPGLLILDCLLEEHSVDFILGSHAGIAWWVSRFGISQPALPIHACFRLCLDLFWGSCQQS